MLLSAFVASLILSGYLFFNYYAPSPAPVAQKDHSLETFQKPSSSDYTLGNPEAEYTLIYYLDYDCPYCATSLETGERFVTRFPTLKVLVRNNPLNTLHPEAPQKAVLVECLVMQGNDFFATAKKMFASQKYSLNNLSESPLAINKETQASCLENKAAQAAVLEDQLEAINLGLYTTPSALLLKDDEVLLKINAAGEKKLESTLQQFLSR